MLPITSMSRCFHGIVIVTALACGGSPREDEPDPMGTEGPGTSGSATLSGTGTGTSASTSNGSAEEVTGEVRLDVGHAGDLGGFGEAGCDDIEELPTNLGCEFWAVDLPNVSVAPLATTPHEQQFAVVVTNASTENTANVEVFVGDEAVAIETGALPPDTMRVFELPSMNITPGATTADGVAYRIESDLPITAYQFQPLDNTTPVYSNDATLLFPTHVLAGDYTAITGDATLVGIDAFSQSDLNTGAFVAVVATQDGTTVTLVPTAAVHPGAITDVMLDRGQVLTTISSERGAPTHGNLSGTRVAADAPVAVFSGSVATSEPTADNPCCADHVEHQMLPLTAWGTSYVAAPAAPARGKGNDASLFRITGGFDGTTLEYSPITPAGAPTTIDAYQTVAFVTETPFTVRASEDDKPFAVAQFLLSNQYFGGFARPGDPSMMLLPAAAQFQNRYVFLMPQGYATNFVTVVAPTTASIELDGAAIAGTPAPAGMLDGVAHDYTHLSVEPGSHFIEGDEPFAIVVSGHSNDVSYGYVGGSGVAVISEPPLPPG
jgi:hypothetical protein